MAIILSPNRVVLKYIDFKKYVDLDVVKTTLEAGQAEMKTWHYDQTKGYVKVLDATCQDSKTGRSNCRGRTK